MTRSPKDAVAWAKGQHQDPSRSWLGMCQMFVRMSYDVGPGFRTATAAWDGANERHPLTDGNRAPRGVPFYWKGGSRGYGHVALTVGNGLCWTNDARRSGKIDLVRINDITRQWGQQPVGWAQDINNVHIWSFPTVDLSDLVAAAEMDPARRTGGTTAGAAADVVRFERALAARGYLNPAYVDGSYGTKTIEAMHRYQRDHGMAGRGMPTTASVRSVIKGRYRLK